MPRQPKHDDAIAYEQACEHLIELRDRLKAGARGAGASLTADECKLLTVAAWELPRPRGRPHDPFRKARMSLYCAALEAKGDASKAAMAAAAIAFGRKRATIYAARAPNKSESK